jgi:uncharacterized protein
MMTAAMKGTLLGALMLAILAGAATAARDKPDRLSIDPPPASLSSFDCKRAATQVERLICGSSLLAGQDGSLAWNYRRLLAHSEPHARESVRQAQQIWLARRDACGDETCLTNIYEARERELWAALVARDLKLRAHVAQEGACEITRVDDVGPRLMGKPPQGTSIGFANGVRQVSYDREAKILRTRIGDPVRVCLVHIPQGCPPGDDRGRIYKATNLRTGGQWRLPDSSHSCGGA